ncbi:LysR substrate-binding domain-containing protein [Ideonella sp. A 288]|uniref:LysR substrate-binding domain-containing protein n=1 Tax=Ideonella sp. A 288 TaxID=1962181 RepID=UPI000B4A7CAF|nr:LysR substrate-binding domain-containing protein [Ideonella sp. A 288]
MNLLESLRYLAALEQHRHFGRAAQACHITQPALSNALRALERDLGVTIVRRGRQYEGLTPEGEVALAHAHRLLREAESLRQHLASRVDAPSGGLLIGAVPTAVPIATRFAARLQARHPGLRPVVRSLASHEIEDGLDTLALDIGLGFSDRQEVSARALSVLPQYEEHCFLLCRADGAAAPFAFGPPIAWREAAELPLVLLTPDMHHRALVDRAFAESGALPEPALQTNSVLALWVAVLEGGHAAVLPGAVVDAARGQAGLVARPLHTPVLRTPVALLSHTTAPPTPAQQAALAMAAEPEWRLHAAAHSGALAIAA